MKIKMQTENILARVFFQTFYKQSGVGYPRKELPFCFYFKLWKTLYSVCFDIAVNDRKVSIEPPVKDEINSMLNIIQENKFRTYEIFFDYDQISVL